MHFGKFIKPVILASGFIIATIFTPLSFAQTWTLADAPFTNWSEVVSSADGTVWFASAGATYGYPVGFGLPPNFNSPIYCSTNSGLTWRPTMAPYTTWSSIACSADGTHVAAAAASGPIYRSEDSGTTWTLTSAPSALWYSIACSAAGDKWVAVANNIIYTSADYGTTWVSNNVPVASWQRVVSSANGNTLYAYEIGYSNSQLEGPIYVSTNSGVTWAATRAPQQNWRSLACSADGTKIIAGPVEPLNACPLYHSSDSGITWTTNAAPTGYWNAIASSADGNKLVAASAYAIYCSADGGLTWKSNTVPDDYWNCVGSSADGNKLAATSSEDGDEGLYISQSTPRPGLSLTPSNGNLTVSWTVPSTNFVLQHSSDLISWLDVTNTPALNLNNLQNQISLSPSNSSDFYRLVTP